MRWILVIVFALLFSRADAAEIWTFQNPVLVPSQAWEFSSGSPNGADEEPKVLGPSNQCLIVAPPCLRMWFTGGWESASIGYAETADLSGKSGFIKYASNPILGQGKGGLANAQHGTVVQNGANICVVVGDGGRTEQFRISCSADGVTNLPTPTVVLSPGAYDLSLGNLFAWQQGSRWHILYEAWDGSAYQVFEATAVDITQPWSKLNGGKPNATLQVTGGGYSNPNVLSLNGVLNIWTHQSPSFGLVLPTSIYHSCEPTGLNGLQWGNGGLPIVSNRPGFDQAADPWAMDLGGTGTLFYSEVLNSTGHAQISVATTTGPLESVSCP